jgi:arylformamidase
MTEYRASFDAAVTFGNGGDLAVHGLRVDVPAADTDEAGIAALFVASLGLLMTDAVELRNVNVFAEPHKGTRGGPSERRAGAPDPGGRLVELSHVIRPGMVTYPGLPGPEITPHLTREASRARYGPGTEFAIDRVTMVGNTGTYLDAPYHRFADGADLAAIPLARTADLPAVVIRLAGTRRRDVTAEALAAVAVRGKAVLLHTGDDARFGTPQYDADAHFLARDGAAWLVAREPALVGIDAVNIDDTADDTRPAHTLLLAAGIPVVEHLTGLEQVPPTGAAFTAVPLRIEGLGTVTVRAFARLPRLRRLGHSLRRGRVARRRSGSVPRRGRGGRAGVAFAGGRGPGRLGAHVIADAGHDVAELAHVTAGERVEQQAADDLDVTGQQAVDEG